MKETIIIVRSLPVDYIVMDEDVILVSPEFALKFINEPSLRLFGNELDA